MTDEEVAAALALAEAATQQGPWVVATQEGNSTVIDANGCWVADCGAAPLDAELIAASRELIPRLCAALRHERDTRLQWRQRYESQVAEQIAAWVDNGMPYTASCIRAGKWRVK